MPFLSIPRAVGVLSLLLLTACSQAAPTHEERRSRIEAISADPAADAVARKARSEARLASEGVPINRNLPVIEGLAGIETRTREAVAWRAMALLVVAAKGEGVDQATVDRIVASYGLQAHFTPAEVAFIRDTSPSDHDRVQFSWRYEAAWTLLWSLGYVETLGKPTTLCDVPRAVGFLMERDASTFIADARPRSPSELLDEADLVYRYHWSVVDARLKGEGAPASLEPGVTMERHHALNWLIGYMDQAWDDVSTDT